MLVGGTILTLDEVGVAWGPAYGIALTAVSGVATVAFMFFLDRGRVITGAAAQHAQRVEVKTISLPAAAGD
jgi:uncharacterized membrane protein YdjX (TVP38/TMEM64 family)